MALLQLAIRIDSRLKRAVEEVCETRGLKMNRLIQYPSSTNSKSSRTSRTSSPFDSSRPDRGLRSFATWLGWRPIGVCRICRASGKADSVETGRVTVVVLKVGQRRDVLSLVALQLLNRLFK